MPCRDEQPLGCKRTADDLSHRLRLPALLYLERRSTLPGNVRAVPCWPSPCQEAAKVKRKLISIIEDDEPFRESMQKLVMLLGYTVEAFASAADFLKSTVVAETDCLVADVQMPGMTGVELYKHLIEAGHPIPTILITAYPNEAVRNRALRNGVVCYLPKPVDDDHLERCLRSALQSGEPAKDQL